MKLKPVGSLIRSFPKYAGKGRFQGFYPPIGCLEAVPDEAMKAGCIQAENENMLQLYTALMAATGLNPCNGCPVWQEHGPECYCFQMYHTAFWQLIQKSKQAKVLGIIQSRLRCPECGLKIRGKNHEAHCKGKAVKK